MNCHFNISFSLQLPYVFQVVRFESASFKADVSFREHKIDFPEQLVRAVDKRKAEYLAGRVCVLKVLQSMGCNDFQVSIGHDREPIWPKGICGSISHSSEMAVAIASNDPTLLGLGVDIEKLMPAQHELQLQNKIIFPVELEVFTALAQQQANPLTIVFSAKESIFKALYPTVKAFFGFEAVELVDFTKNTLLFRLTETLNICLRAGTMLTVYFQQNTDTVLTECALYASGTKYKSTK